MKNKLKFSGSNRMDDRQFINEDKLLFDNKPMGIHNQSAKLMTSKSRNDFGIPSLFNNNPNVSELRLIIDRMLLFIGFIMLYCLLFFFIMILKNQLS